jgi:thiol:disulfide interchange protein DsbA
MERLAVFFALLMASGAVAAATSSLPIPTSEWRAGVDYVIHTPAPVRAAQRGKILVVEAFSYTCIHCYRFEPYIRDWLKTRATEVEFVRVPSQWDAKHQAHARLYYVLHALGRGDLDQAVFDAIHRDKNPLFAGDEQGTRRMQADFATAHGIDRQAFENTYDSEAVKTRLAQAAAYYASYQLLATPGIVIQGRYVTDVSRIISDEVYSQNNEQRAFTRMVGIASYLTSLAKSDISHQNADLTATARKDSDR